MSDTIPECEHRLNAIMKDAFSIGTQAALDYAELKSELHQLRAQVGGIADSPRVYLNRRGNTQNWYEMPSMEIAVSKSTENPNYYDVVGVVVAVPPAGMF